MLKKEFPILEYDEERNAYIEPNVLVEKEGIPKYCVIVFFRDVIENKKEKGLLTEIATTHSEMIDIPIYEIEYDGKKYVLHWDL